MTKTFERWKLLQAIVYFATNTNHVGVVKLFKLLYYLDMLHFRETGRSVTGLTYHALPYGPVPTELYDELDRPADGRLLMLKTTSRPRASRPDPDGCHSDASVFRFKQYLGGFRIPTWVQFDPPIIRTPQQAIDSATTRAGVN